MRKVVSMRVLVVDDQDDFRMGLRSILEAEDALERVIGLGPDVVLMDVHIPGISGIDATQRLLRQDPRTAVVVLSMYEGEELIRLAPRSSPSPRRQNASEHPCPTQCRDNECWPQGQHSTTLLL
jgi:CheY-like chemotaxis protein